ncbi:ABC transporter permease [Tissierella sp. MSJ-40]|uniref:ABC transporter permease n=1 Tax=Tissierella simiarum TaxID=2841534 RepID=A0ABS6E6B0_9FIRM|nr:ABC transporter permease [Tissierella simiarum]MBU5438464.1 ABC transporter permease [Tissierella simiarum]
MIFDIIGFEMKQQVKSIIFWLCVLLFVGFTYSEMSYIFYLPVKSDADIRAIKGYHEYLYVDRTEEELREYVIYRLKSMEKAGVNVEGYMIQLGEKMDKEGLSILQIMNYVRKEKDTETAEWIEEWIKAFMDNGKERLGTVKEVNKNLRSWLGDKAYTYEVSMNYADLAQLVGGILILPIFALLFSKDRRYRMNELIHTKQVKSHEYVLGRYFGCFLSFFLSVFILGICVDSIICIKFGRAGWNTRFLDMIVQILIYVLPSLLFASALIVTLSLVFKNGMAVIPIYILYFIFNVTEGVFIGRGNFSVTLYKFLIRTLIVESINDVIIQNRIIYMALTVVLLIVSCKIWEKSDKKSWRVV